jgi:hypothetical protein
MDTVADHTREAARYAEAAARFSSSKQVITDNGTIIPDSDILAYKDRAFESLCLAVIELAKAVEVLAKAD